MSKIKTVMIAFLPFYGAETRFRAWLRIRDSCQKKKRRFCGQIVKTILKRNYGCELSINADISPLCKFMHTVGVVIGEEVVVEECVQIFSNVCLGRKDITKDDDYPIIKKDAVLSTGSTVLGKVIIGEGVVIGANALVITSCDTGIWGGVPAVRLKS